MSLRPGPLALRRAHVVVGVVVLALSGAAAAVGASPIVRDGSLPCRYPGAMVTDRWVGLSGPPGVTTISLQQLDPDPCVLVAADSAGGRWRSTDAGVHWGAISGGVQVRRLLSERLQPRAGTTPMGPVLAVGSAAGDPAGSSHVYVSDDEGVTFTPARLTVGAAAPPGPLEQLAELQMDLISATTAVRYVDGHPEADVFAAGRISSTLVPALPVEGAGTVVKSTDGGKSFVPVDSTRQLVVTAIAVNPTSTNEIWVNDIRPGSGGGGAWVSFDGGGTFKSACCPEATVRDISITAGPDGGIVVLLATDTGLLRSVDDGSSWEKVTDGAYSGVRTPVDDPSTILVAADGLVLMSSGAKTDFKPVPGLPSSCSAGQLRRDDRVPSTFLVDCGHQTYRMLLTRYGGHSGPDGPVPGPLPTIPGGRPPTPVGRPLTELTRWALPGSNSATGSIAFDGKIIYYDMNKAGDIGRVRASDGFPLEPLRTELAVQSMTVDLRRNELIVTSANGSLYALDLVTHKVVVLGTPPTNVASYDSFGDGLSWVPEFGKSMFRRSRTGTGRGTAVCRLNYVPVGTSPVVGESDPSTFVASGDGGGYVQSEDDATIYRLDRNCIVLGTYSHRVFSESSAENDAMACDTQSFFPQPAIWIRDSVPQTVTAYTVPFGYCPMPSRLTVVLPRDVVAGTVTSLCADLVNASNDDVAVNRGVEMSVAGVVVGHGQTDARGRACLPYVAVGGFQGRRDVVVTARFAGDSALYPSSAKATLGVLDSLAVPPAPRQPAALVPPPPPPAAVPANPAPNPGPAGAPGPAPAPNAANAPAGQMQANSQPVAQGVVAPQRQQQAQLALARAANQIGPESNQMVAPAQRIRPLPVGLPTAAVLAMCCVGVAAAVRPSAARERGPAARRRASRSAPPRPMRWR
jgi:hypothetical protein